MTPIRRTILRCYDHLNCSAYLKSNLKIFRSITMSTDFCLDRPGFAQRHSKGRKNEAISSTAAAAVVVVALRPSCKPGTTLCSLLQPQKTRSQFIWNWCCCCGRSSCCCGCKCRTIFIDLTTAWFWLWKRKPSWNEKSKSSYQWYYVAIVLKEYLISISLLKFLNKLSFQF